MTPFLKKKKDGTFQFHIRNKNIQKVPIKNLLDVGCCAGHMLRMYCDLLNPEKAFGFEPCITNYFSAKNRCPGADIHNVAVSDVDGFADLNLYESKSRHSLLPRKLSNKAIIQPIKTIRLDTWANRNGVESLDFVKIDTQGFDTQVMAGMGDLIRTVKIMIVEVMTDSREYDHIPPFSTAFRIAEAAGMHLHSFRDVYHDNKGSVVAVDAMFMNDEAMYIICE